MPHSAEKLLQDILDAADAISAFTTGKTLDVYRSDRMLRSAVERQFEIIGEALRRLAALHPDLAAEIPEHQRIIAFRNIIAHGYEVLEATMVWQAVRDKLPVLRDCAAVILKRLLQPGK